MKELILLKVTKRMYDLSQWLNGYNGCHDLSMLSVNIRNNAIITVKNVDYRCTIHKISKSEAIN